MASVANSRLGDSWVVNSTDEENISWDEDDGGSDADAPELSPTYKQTRKVLARPNGSANSAHSAATEQQFIMPSMETQSPRKRRSTPMSQSTMSKKHYNKSSTAPQPSPKAQSISMPKRMSARPKAIIRDTSPSIADQGFTILWNIAEWFLDIVGFALKHLKKPLSWLLAAYLFAGLLVLVQNLFTSSIYSALSPICRIPGVSFLNLPICQYSSPASATPRISSSSGKAPVEFDALMSTQNKFETILSDSMTGVSLPLDMKRSETSIRDLRQVVRFSQLSSKNELVLEFDGFIETARIASYDLQKFNSHVGRGVDIVLATARWTQRVLDDMAFKQSSRGLLPNFIHNQILAPFQPLQFTESRLLDQYIQHTRIVSEEIDKLIDEAQALLLVLQNLEDRLDVIHSVALRDNLAAQASKDEILSQLWTLLGGNRAQLGKYNNQLKLLRQVSEYRKVAWAHVSGTILKLQAMGAELEELRTRVGSAEVLRDHKEIPLSVHVESIKLGVERLEQGRERARELERGHVRRVIDAADTTDDGKLLVGT